MIRLVWTLFGNAQVLGLLGGQLGQLDVQGVQVGPGDLLVELLGEHEDSDLVVLAVLPQLDLGEDLVAEGVGHDEAGMSHGTSKVNKTTFSQQKDVLSVLEGVSVDLGLDVGLELAVLFEPLNFNFAVKVTNVTNNSVVLHLEEVLAGQDVLAAGGGDEDVTPGDGVLDGGDLVAFHGGLESVDGIDLGDYDSASESSQRLCASLSDISVSSNECNLGKTFSFDIQQFDRIFIKIYSIYFLHKFEKNSISIVLLFHRKPVSVVIYLSIFRRKLRIYKC